MNFQPPRLGHRVVGNALTMDRDRSDMSPAEQLWWEAEVAVQCDLDEDVRLEARGLAVAEMSDVLLSERLAAVAVGAQMGVLLRSGRRYSGTLVRVGSDFLILRRSADHLIPAAAIVGVFAAPRVLHADTDSVSSVAPTSWRSVLREMLGASVHVSAGRFDLSGRLTWVGRDHVTIASPATGERCDDLTIVWSHVDVVTAEPS